MTQPQSSPGEQLLHRGRKFDFALITQPGRSGRPIRREIVRHPGSVILIPLVYGPEIFGPGVFGPERGPAVLFVRQVRVALGVPCLELPAGTLERGENPFGCAARELIEETGYQAATVRTLGRFYTSPGLSDELMHAFVASDLTHVGQAMEDDEDIEVVPLPLHEVWRMVQAGELMDGKSITALALAAAQGHIPGWSEVGSHGR